MAFCGHAAIATAERDGPGLLQFSTLAGLIAVQATADPAGVTATLTSVPTRTRAAETAELQAALTALRWRGEDLDPRYPAHVAYAGNDHLIVAVRDRARLAVLDYDYPALEVHGGPARLDHRAPRMGREPDCFPRTRFHARDPFPPGGVVEDPATGAAAAFSSTSPPKTTASK